MHQISEWTALITAYYSQDCPGENEVFDERKPGPARQAPKTPVETPKRPNVASPPYHSRGIFLSLYMRITSVRTEWMQFDILNAS